MVKTYSILLGVDLEAESFKYHYLNKNPHEFFHTVKSTAQIYALYEHPEHDSCLLITHRLQKLRNFSGELSVPGGGFDEVKDTNTLDTAIRETGEEVGIKVKDPVYFGSIHTPIGHKIDMYYTRVTEDDIKNMVVQSTEVEAAYLIPLKIMREKSFYNITTQDIDYRKNCHVDKFKDTGFKLRVTLFQCHSKDLIHIDCPNEKGEKAAYNPEKPLVYKAQGFFKFSTEVLAKIYAPQNKLQQQNYPLPLKENEISNEGNTIT